MIPLDFDYYRPNTVYEATQVFTYLDSCRKEPLYFGGGTEIITFGRTQKIHTKAVVDLKLIPECHVLDFSGHKLIIGACVSLTKIIDSQIYTLLGKTCAGIADHTVRGKITIGGNVCGQIIYHEAILPLFLADCKVVIAGVHGCREAPIWQVFNKQLCLNRGEFVVQFVVDRSYLRLPFAHVKKTRNAKIEYPLVSVAAVKTGGRIRIAFSGVCSFPFRSLKMEEYLNREDLLYVERIQGALANAPAPLLDDLAGTSEYRRFVLSGILMNLLET